MTRNTAEASELSTENRTLPPTVLFELLANDDRRDVLRYLSQTAGATSIEDIAATVARWRSDRTESRTEELRIALHHIHLPKLVDEGVVRYDPETRTVERLGPADALSPYLQLAAAADIADMDDSREV